MRVLVVAPHADDETLGVGGTIARHVERGDSVTVLVMTGSGEEPHPIFPNDSWDEVRAEAKEAAQVLGVERLVFRDVPAVLVPETPTWKLNSIASEAMQEWRPDRLYVPFPYDMHRDHREVFHSFSVAWRASKVGGYTPAEVFAYEVPSETHWNPPYLEPGFLPHCWVDISRTLDRKIQALSCYQSQIPAWPHARSLEALTHLARWRGSQVGWEAAEAFVLIRKLEAI